MADLVLTADPGGLEIGSALFQRGKAGFHTFNWDFPGGPVAKTSPFYAGGTGSIPGWGAEISHASWPKIQNKKRKNKQKTEAML